MPQIPRGLVYNCLNESITLLYLIPTNRREFKGLFSLKTTRCWKGDFMAVTGIVKIDILIRFKAPATTRQLINSSFLNIIIGTKLTLSWDGFLNKLSLLHWYYSVSEVITIHWQGSTKLSSGGTCWHSRVGFDGHHRCLHEKWKCP